MTEAWPVSRTCKYCKGIFFTFKKGKIYCGGKCAKEASVERARKLTYTKHCKVCGSDIPVWKSSFCTPCSIDIVLVKRKEKEKRHLVLQEHYTTAKQRYRDNQKNLAAIGRAAIEMFPHLKELLNDPS